jgi:hypothetical protein
MLSSLQALTPLFRRTPVIAADPTLPVRAVDDLNRDLRNGLMRLLENG